MEKQKKKAEEERLVKAVSLTKQGAWTNWDSARDISLSCKEMWQIDQRRLSFLLRTLTDLLPSPANLKQWQIEELADYSSLQVTRLHAKPHF